MSDSGGLQVVLRGTKGGTALGSGRGRRLLCRAAKPRYLAVQRLQKLAGVH